MTDAPERIWAGAIADQMMLGYATRVWGDDPRVGTDAPAVEYIRADLIARIRAEERERWVGMAASLAAAISLLERGGKEAAASDKMFDQMLKDYRRALEKYRAAIRNMGDDDD